MFVLLTLFSLGGVLALVATLVRKGRARAFAGTPFLLLMTLGACYVAGFLAISADPFFDDNGSPEFIELRFRWVWAAVFGGMFSFVAVPLALTGKAAWRWWRRRDVGSR